MDLTFWWNCYRKMLWRHASNPNTTMKLLFVMTLLCREAMCGSPSVQIGRICYSVVSSFSFYYVFLCRKENSFFTHLSFSCFAPMSSFVGLFISILVMLLTGLLIVQLLLQCSNCVNVFFSFFPIFLIRKHLTNP